MIYIHLPFLSRPTLSLSRHPLSVSLSYAMAKLPLQSSAAHNASAGDPTKSNGAAATKKTIEEMYQKKTQLEHILLRPDTYIGSIEKHTQTLWVWDSESSAMVSRQICYVPGLYKIFDEILVNAADNKQRDPKMDSVKVVIDPAENLISVYNTGDGVPVEVHQEEGVYVPEMIFGHLLTSSNYDDNEKKTTGGRNGYGAKLTNIFSTEFVIETADGKRQKKYKQVFKDNMGEKSEPSITKCKAGENWTKVTFKPDLAKFNMTELEDDVVALMKKRVVDIAGTLGKTVKVELNGQRLPVKSFVDYVNLYLPSGDKHDRFTEKVNDRWEIFVTRSDGQFQQVSFVNGINTIKGGSHVDYVTNQITSHLVEVVNKKKKNANLKAHNVKNHLWVFVNALVDNPAFDSQTKETLTTRKDRFGSKCELSPGFLKKVATSDIVSSIEEWADFKLTKDLKKTDGTKRQKITGITKLDDANLAGGKDSDKCTLILTEGDSAKALALAGITVVGRDRYGVFPLRGKLLNVREASHKQIVENAEIQHIKQILGLQQGKVYDSVKGLRYGHLMIMTDQDHDGSHIKGLLINFIHSFWPSLLKVPSFLVEFITPIVKVEHKRNRKNKMSFYTMPEYEAWKETVGDSMNRDWKIKYYKGLGTSTAAEGKDYFSDLGKHKKDFVWAGEQDGNAIELAFSKKKIEERKNWLRQFEPGTYLDCRDKLIKYRDFVNKELILFSMADLQRSIPSMVDGLKPGQRKILFCAFKRNLVTEYKVAQFSGYVAEHSAYHHGETSLASTITGMAQDFVGSNNLNLLSPGGQFGTRHRGGKDHGAARYIFTNLMPLTRYLFHKDDDIILDYLNEDGDSIEPMWYIPIIPMVLVNGSEGIGTGWSSFVPNYNPKDIIANVRRLLNDESLQPMDPWYRGFKGLIEKSAVKDTGATYTMTGIIEEVDCTTLRITELPIRKWTLEYKQFLEAMITGDDKIKEPFIKDFKENHGITTVHFEIILSEENLIAAKQEGLEKKFKLTTTISTSNMHLFDAKGVIKKYDTPEQILEEFYHLRLQFYEKRKTTLLNNLELEFLKMDNKVRFILSVVHGELIVNNRKRSELFLELHQKGYTPFPSKSKANDVTAVEENNDADEHDKDGSDMEENESETMEESPEIAKEEPRASDYEYLLSMAIGTLTLEKVQQLCREKERLGNEIEILRNTTIKSLWLKDLDAFEAKLDVEESKRAKKLAKEEEKEMVRRMKEMGVKVPKKAPAKPRKNIASNATADTTTTVTDAAKAKPRGGGPKKAPAKKTTSMADKDGDDDDVCPLTERLAAYNLNSSSDCTSMETEGAAEEVTKKNEPRKRATTSRKPKQAVTISDDEEDSTEPMPAIAEDIDDDDDFEFEMVGAPKAKKGAAKKPAAKKAAATATARSRGAGGAQAKRLSSQRLITDVLKPATSVFSPAGSAASPEKKVRRMRASPFNKKSSSVLGSGDSGGSSTSSNVASALDAEAAVARINRPKRETRPKVTYVESDGSEEEEEEPLTEDSDFGEDEA